MVNKKLLSYVLSFLKMGQTQPFFIYFRLFKHTLQILRK